MARRGRPRSVVSAPDRRLTHRICQQCRKERLMSCFPLIFPEVPTSTERSVLCEYCDPEGKVLDDLQSERGRPHSIRSSLRKL